MYIALTFEIDQSVYEQIKAKAYLNDAFFDNLMGLDYGGDLDGIIIGVTIAPVTAERFYKPRPLKIRRNVLHRSMKLPEKVFRKFATGDVTIPISLFGPLSKKEACNLILKHVSDFIARELIVVSGFDANRCAADVLESGTRALDLVLYQ